MTDSNHQSGQTSEGLKCYRQMAQFLSVKDEVEFSLIERRYSIAMITRSGDFPIVNLIYVLDPDTELETAFDFSTKRLQLREGKEIASFVYFQSRINELFGCWRRDWTEVLDKIDKVLQVEVR
jgi:hypothetical protein